MCSIHHDYEKNDDELWKIFDCKDKLEQYWYYGAFRENFEEIAETEAWQGYKAHVEAVFGN